MILINVVIEDVYSIHYRLVLIAKNVTCLYNEIGYVYFVIKFSHKKQLILKEENG